MAKGAVHPNGSNFRRVCKLDIVERMRKLVHQGLYQRPRWLESVERYPPLELQNLHLKSRTIRNPYFNLVGPILRKYPNLRFQDCYVDGNDWSKGNDTYRDDHPVMQFAARQLQFMNNGMSRRAAFAKTEQLFYERRIKLEKQQKLLMAMATDEHVEPMFTTGQAYWQSTISNGEAKHLARIRDVLRSMQQQVKRNKGTDSQLPQISDSNKQSHHDDISATVNYAEEVSSDEYTSDDTEEEDSFTDSSSEENMSEDLTR